jgi:GTP-binding protein Era
MSVKKSGFVVLVGRSNVGKSTLLNALIGSKVAITTPKPQTTRLPVQGILSNEFGQAVFVDTPGIMKKSKDALTRKLVSFAKDAMRDVDVVIYVADPTRSIGDEEKSALQMISLLPQPRVLVINKSDLPDAPYLDHYRDLAPTFSAVVELSAMTGKNVNTLVNVIFELLPQGDPFYPEGQLTNMPNKQWLAELIREKLFLRLRQEVPYTTHVEVEELENHDGDVLYIKANVLTTEERYKRMIIGRGGQGIKEIGQSTRRELEAVMDRKVFLDLNVDVDAHWLDRLG